MLIAHLPFGYLLSRAWLAWRGKAPRPALAWGLAGSVFPDTDLLWRHWQHDTFNHHLYWTHLPLFWLVVLVVGLLACRIRRRPDLAAILSLFVLNVFGHLLLDRDIWWLYPFLDQPLTAIAFLNDAEPWRLKLVLHSRFAMELIIVGAGLMLLAVERPLWRRPVVLNKKGN